MISVSVSFPTKYLFSCFFSLLLFSADLIFWPPFSQKLSVNQRKKKTSMMLSLAKLTAKCKNSDTFLLAKQFNIMV